MFKRKLVKICSLLMSSLGFFFFSCSDSGVSNLVNNERLFTLSYGAFEDQIDLFDLATVGPINTFMTMRDGFFYIANGESKKIMEMNSYGDLLTLYYNSETNVKPSFVLEGDAVNSTRKAISYHFNSLGEIAVDSRKCVYVVDVVPQEQQINSTDDNLVYKQVVLRFASDGTILDYIGQQGVGGTPFPFVKNIYTTTDDELLVVCVTNQGLNVYWFNTDGQLLYVIPIRDSDLPNPFSEKSADDFYLNADGLIPSAESHVLFIKIDYFSTHVDQDSRVQSGIDYVNTLLYPLNVESGIYGDPIQIPPYEEMVSEGFGKIVYTLPYEFIGVTKTGWMYFSIPIEGGYMLQMVQPDGQRILKRQIKLDSDNLLYYTFSLSETGILSGLFAYPDKSVIEWWRLDTLIENLTEG